MHRTFPLGRLAGIEIGAHWSWLIVAWLIGGSLAAGVFPEENPGLSDGTHWAMGVVATVLFFAAIVLHEVGHALQARREGADVEGITLWLFGGVARLRAVYRSPGAELRIAVAGPLVTLVIAAALIGLAGLDLPEAVDGVVSWLGYINLFLLVFNLIPAQPLDGGRVLHAVLWAAVDDRAWATRIGAAVGQAFGLVLVGGGLVLVLTAAALGGVWLVLLGGFLTWAATAEVAAAEARDALRGLRVRDVMSPDPVAVPQDLTIARFVDGIASATRYTAYPVVDGAQAVGLLSFRHVLATPRSEWDRRTVGDCMVARPEAAVVSPDTPAADALDALEEGPRRALVIDADGTLVGLLSITDAIRAAQTHRPGPAAASTGRAGGGR